VNTPRLTLITASFQRCEMLREALASVPVDGPIEIEHWVIDGGSSDGTIDLLRSSHRVHFLCEPDRGVYDAWNKGLARATGEWVGFLNSDDLLVPESFNAVAETMRGHDVDLITGAVEFFSQETSGIPRTLRRLSAARDLELNLRNVLRQAPVVNARFYRRAWIAAVGALDTGLTIAADREWLLRMARQSPRQRVIPECVYRYREHPGSLTVHSTKRNVARYRAEHADLAERHLREPGLSGSGARLLRSFHRRETATLAGWALREGRHSEFRHWAARGLQQSKLWPGTFLRRLVGMVFE
jgi:glycosyltransferase involved in cell wall biosynthesis